MSFVRLKLIAIGLAMAGLSACAGNGTGLNASGDPGSGGHTVALTADFQSIQDNIFTPICTKCHAGAGAPEGLQLDATHSYASLVGVPSTEQPNVLRVAAGNPDNSYIVRKLEGTGGIAGVRMPFGGPYLPQSTIDVIRAWIVAGAPQSVVASVGAAAKSMQRFEVVSTSPDPDSVVTMVLPRIVVAFSNEVDASLVNDTSIMLQKIPAMQTDPGSSVGADDLAVAPPLPVSLSIPTGNSAAVLITPRAALSAGTYRVTLRGTGGAALAGTNARALAGDYTFTFTVETLQ